MEDNTAQLKCAEGVVTQSADVVGSYLGGATEDNSVIGPTPLSVPGLRRGSGQEELVDRKN